MASGPPDNFEETSKALANELDVRVFSRLRAELAAEPRLRATLNPAFPFPAKLRIGALDSHLVVEYVGPDDPEASTFEIEAVWIPGRSVSEFLGLDVAHLNVPRLPIPQHIANTQTFLGGAIALLGDYMYDLLHNPNDVILNGFPALDDVSRPTCMSNCSFLWSGPDEALRIKRFDYVEIFPVDERGWAFHTEESLDQLAAFLLQLRLPRYKPELHHILNEFIVLVSQTDTSEPMITSFLSLNPELLQLAFGAHALNPQILLQWQYEQDSPDLKPDFLPTRMDGFVDILEFKLPWLKTAPIVGTVPRRMPSHEVDAALEQVDTYAEWCDQEVNRRWLLKHHDIKILYPQTILVIGHSSEFAAADRQKLRSRRNATIFTYDEFIEMARMQLYRTH